MGSCQGEGVSRARIQLNVHALNDRDECRTIVLRHLDREMLLAIRRAIDASLAQLPAEQTIPRLSDPSES